LGFQDHNQKFTTKTSDMLLSSHVFSL
jgi:hypothetical protein